MLTSPLGTSLIALPSDIAELINKELGAKKSWNGQYTLDCALVPDLPDFTLYFGGKPYVLEGKDYILEVQGELLIYLFSLPILTVLPLTTCACHSQ